jgi:hypothetical protein
MRVSLGLRAAAASGRHLAPSRRCTCRWLAVVVPLLSVIIFASLWVSRALHSPARSHALVLRAGGTGPGKGHHRHDQQHQQQAHDQPPPPPHALGVGGGHAPMSFADEAAAAAAMDTARRAAEHVFRAEQAESEAEQAGGGPAAAAAQHAQAPSAARGPRRPPLNLFLVWTGDKPVPTAEFDRLLGDVLSQTAAGAVHLYFLLDEAHMGGPPLARVEGLLGKARATASGVGVPFSWALASVQSYTASSANYRHLCADFKANVSPGAQAYTCNYLFKPLLWEIVELMDALAGGPPSTASGGGAVHDGTDYGSVVLALDTDLRVAGDVTDLLLAHVPTMRRQGALFGLVEEQQPTYAFNSPRQAQGFNGGVQVIDVAAQRESALYRGLVAEFSWSRSDPRWRPATDLGDQTLYSLLNYSQPALFHTVGCEWNRQMCRVWFTFFPGRDRTSKADFLHYEEKALCRAPVVRILHGNCKSNRPGSDELAGLPDAWQPRNAAAEAEMEAAFERMKGTPEEVLQGKVKPGAAPPAAPPAAAAAAAAPVAAPAAAAPAPAAAAPAPAAAAPAPAAAPAAAQGVAAGAKG